LTLVASLSAHAGSLRTIDGRVYEGVLKLEPTGHVSVVPVSGPTPAPVALDDVLYADFRAPEPAKPAARPAQAVRNTEAGDLPAGWRATAVGTLAEAPYAKFRSGQFSLKSAGAEVGGTRDACTYLSQPVGPDVDLVACLHDTANGQVVTGVTIRAGSAADAPHVSLLYFGDDIRFVRRTRAGRSAEGGPVGGHVNLPIWMRLTRRGDTVTTSLSKDGQSWEEVGQATFTPPAAVPVTAGLTTFGRSEQLAGAHYTNVRLVTSLPREDAAVPAAAAATPSAASATSFTPLKPATLKRGLLLRSGTLIANADVYRADEGTVRYTKAGRGEQVSMVNVARILMRDLAPSAADKIPPKGAGLLLKEGDFVEGEFKGLRDNRVSLSSVLFGLKAFEARDKVAAIVINDPEPGRPAAIVRTTDGSTYVAGKLSMDKNRLVIEEPLAGQVTIDRADVAELSIGAARLEPLAGLTPEKVEPANSLVMADAPRPITLPAGASATWALNGRYRTFTATCAVPAGVLPTVPVRFVVLADGKELFRSPPRTSLDSPVGVAATVNGAETLILRVESTAPGPFPVPGTWIDAALIK
jgi:hypothetical protein